jgi:hypothetical protein
MRDVFFITPIQDNAPVRGRKPVTKNWYLKITSHKVQPALKQILSDLAKIAASRHRICLSMRHMGSW